MFGHDTWATVTAAWDSIPGTDCLVVSKKSKAADFVLIMYAERWDLKDVQRWNKIVMGLPRLEVRGRSKADVLAKKVYLQKMSASDSAER